ncbi:unnamed protein product [Psylliodes chrysocephalus]|uniref:Uncharacterized protein n=1 Tax=Psylliodes chrysocephalus TaxID=3402493 RepID=A0A9P0GKC7_9CUCU|nr:unnamed protein product [Psylliodes chrysocephala]
MKYAAFVILFTAFLYSVSAADPECTVSSCSKKCQAKDHFGGYCYQEDGEGREVCHCYDLQSQKKDDPKCTVAACSKTCQAEGHFDGNCFGDNSEICRCYDIV